jgi:hypothetical protein
MRKFWSKANTTGSQKTGMLCTAPSFFAFVRTIFCYATLHHIFFASGRPAFFAMHWCIFVGERSPFGSGAILSDIDFPSIPPVPVMNVHF